MFLRICKLIFDTAFTNNSRYILRQNDGYFKYVRSFLKSRFNIKYLYRLDAQHFPNFRFEAGASSKTVETVLITHGIYVKSISQQ